MPKAVRFGRQDPMFGARDCSSAATPPTGVEFSAFPDPHFPHTPLRLRDVFSSRFLSFFVVPCEANTQLNT